MFSALPRTAIFFSVVLLLLLLKASSATHDGRSSPPVDFGADIDASPVLVKPMYDQFAFPPHHRNSHKRIGRKKLEKWLERVKVKASGKQVDALWRMIKADEKGKGDAWVEVRPGHGDEHGGERGERLKGGRPRKWGEEGETTKHSSEKALPEPAQRIPAATSGRNIISVGAGQAEHQNITTPVTMAPSSSSFSMHEPSTTTVGSINPSSTPPPPPSSAPPTDDPRYTPIASNTNQTISGIPVLPSSDDGDMKIPAGKLVNSTKPGSITSSGGGSTRFGYGKENGNGGGGSSGVIAAVVVVVVVLFAV